MVTHHLDIHHTIKVLTHRWVAILVLVYRLLNIMVMDATLVGGSTAAAAAAYGVHHLTHGHHPHGHHLGHFGKFKHHHHGYYGKFKHGKFGKHIGLGGKHGLLRWKHHHHGFFGGKYKRWK
ncbi:unnamed protein product [Miscanthus lutarioriparius]|uniref:Uncharacterized protein n=1 Tax=Miscanthus lutarioriparius TaxID=422564 RepID=A0A811QI58_9POAL|nr:unnamed protein product [Miscanthus lutarioriparius]